VSYAVFVSAHTTHQFEKLGDVVVDWGDLNPTHSGDISRNIPSFSYFSGKIIS